MSNLNERAEQLALHKRQVWELLDKSTHWTDYPHFAVVTQAEDFKMRLGNALVLIAESIAADSATLARGLAIEQAAQHVCRMDNEFAILECSCGWVAERYDAELWKAHLRSLDPDAAQALAHHNATVFHDTLDDLAHDGSELVVGGKEPVRIFSEQALAAHDRAERLDEAKRWRTYTEGDDEPYWCAERIAALAESQPAPATPPKDSPMTLLVNALNDPRWQKESSAFAREVADRAQKEVEAYHAKCQVPAPAKEDA